MPEIRSSGTSDTKVLKDIKDAVVQARIIASQNEELMKRLIEAVEEITNG